LDRRSTIYRDAVRVGIAGRRRASNAISGGSAAKTGIGAVRFCVARGCEMRPQLTAMLLAAMAFGQDARVARGEKVFAANCSVPYCHGANSSAGRAPRLVGHTFTSRELTNIVSNGVANKGMPPFGAQLSSDDLDAVVAYVTTLRGSSPGSGNVAP